ncbi:MAG: alpha/beta hydrolase [Gammaproteobacteria bacterium]
MTDPGHACNPALLLLLVLLSFPASGSELPLSDCMLLDASGARATPARCGTLAAAANPALSDPDQDQIELQIAVIPALTESTDGIAFTVLAGGPGGSAKEFYAAYAPAFRYIHRHMDIILVDQRGTGGSAPLDCPRPPELEWDVSSEQISALSTECLESLDRDPAPFTTSLAVQDLDAVRAALGYQTLHLYGGSYGTRVAMHYLRRYPEQTKSLILDGVVPPGLALGPDIALRAQQALDQLFSRCASDPACNQRFPNLAGQFQSLRQRLMDDPVSMTLPHPVSGEPVELEFGQAALVTAIRLLSYNDNGISLLPLLISNAAEGRMTPLAAQSLMVAEGLGEALSAGMHNTVVCSEDLPFVRMDRDQWQALDSSYLGRAPLEGLQAVCKIWPTGPVDPDLREPLVSDHPVLLLSGSVDPITPPAYADMAQQGLSASRHLVVEGHGHGVAALGCLPRLLDEFITTGDAAAIDASCLERITPAPIFLDFSGPGP